ncbi:MAG: hypothetical protein ACOZB3_11035 [Calditrichota bacterium]
MRKSVALVVIWLMVALAAIAAAQPYLTTYYINGKAYRIVTPGTFQISDTLRGLTPLVLTFKRTPGAEHFTMAVRADSVSAVLTPATDSLAAWNRCIPKLAEIDSEIGSALYPMVWRTANGDTATILNWDPGKLYFVADIVLDECPYWQFTFIGSAGDTIPVTIYFIQGEQ